MNAETHNVTKQEFGDNLIFPYPLYHGTSAQSLGSIFAHGLGGRDIIREQRMWEAFDELDDYLAKSVGEMQPIEADWAGVSEFVRQKIKIRSRNYQYGKVYASTKFDAAEMYAGGTGGSGELAGFLERMLREAVMNGYTFSPNHFPIFNTFGTYGTPVVVKVAGIPVSAMYHENGEAVALDFIKRLQEVLPMRIGGMPRFDFRLDCVITAEQIEVLDIERFGCEPPPP